MKVDHDLLADYVGGALEGTPEQERVARLIAASAEWGHAAEELTTALHGVRHDLNVLRETPEPMPEDVTARFEDLFDGHKRDPLESRLVTPRPGRAGRPKMKGWKRWAAPVAVMTAALGVFAVGKVPSMVAPTMSDSAGGTDSRVLEQAPAAVPPAPVPTAATWQMYDRGNLDQALTSASSPYGSRSSADESLGATQKADGATRPAPLQRLTDPAALQQCLDAVTMVVPGRVDFVEYAYFEGSPALVITITSNSGLSRFVAGGNCGQTGPDEKFKTPPK